MSQTQTETTTATKTADAGAAGAAAAAAIATKTETKVDAKAAAVTDGKVEFKLPDEYKGKDGQPDVAKIVGKFSEFEAERNARGLPPEGAEKYEFVAPKDLKLPDGSPAEIDPDSAIFQKFREVAFGLKLSQADAQKLFELGVEREFDLLAQVRREAETNLAAEKAKLGSKHEARINNVGNWLKAHFGKEGEAAIERWGNSDDIILMEKMIAKFGGAGAAGASNAGKSGSKGGDELAALYPSMAKG